MIPFLSWTLPDYAGLDFLRFVTGVACLLVAVMAVKLLVGARREECDQIHERERDSAIARSLALFILGSVEFQQIGHRFLPWRLPLVMLCLFFCARVSWRRM